EDVPSIWCRPHLGTLRWPQLDVTCTRGRQTVRLSISPCEHHETTALLTAISAATCKRPSLVRARERGSQWKTQATLMWEQAKRARRKPEQAATRSHVR